MYTRTERWATHCFKKFDFEEELADGTLFEGETWWILEDSLYSRLVYLNDSRCDSSGAKAGDLMAITGNCSDSSRRRHELHRQRARPSHYCTHRGSEIQVTYPAASQPCTCSAPRWDLSFYESRQ
ncbi:hypothetical protein AVEN_40132-1 [Araneus ventricosus]|uniref:Uncharacterized protein n=1 Tax=Araneus ventricosus TaxID=182803 RepID=A0A4Y2EMR3_ARAVE|nr:hypothetical protein AVEN_40132-1 [Araneus ventricosus]